MSKWEELNTLAQAVKGWGNCDKAWYDNSEDEPAAVVGHISEEGTTYPVATVDCDQYFQAQDSLKLARFYAAANPSAILELLAERDALKAELERIRAMEPFGTVTVRRARFEHHADQYQFFPKGQPPYLDTADECHVVYTLEKP